MISGHPFVSALSGQVTVRFYGFVLLAICFLVCGLTVLYGEYKQRKSKVLVQPKGVSWRLAFGLIATTGGVITLAVYPNGSLAKGTCAYPMFNSRSTAGKTTVG